MSESFDNLIRQYRDINALNAAIGLMSWDRQVLMPIGGAQARTAHIEILTRKVHELMTGDELARTLETVERTTEPGSVEALQAAALRREVNIESKLPAELVDRKARISSDSYEEWKVAKATNDFSRMIPYYEQLFEIAGETAGLLGYKDHVYDALIDLYEPGATYANASAMFEAIKSPIVGLVARIRQEGEPVDDSLLSGRWDKDRLRDTAEATIGAIGFKFDRGRLNIAPNAFCMNLSCDDVRMTTRASDHIKGILSSSLHEMGHALYEQNSPKKWDRTPLAGGVSLAVHESQSRLWENIVGRSKGFWKHFLPSFQTAFPSLAPYNSDGFYRALNKVSPEFIRVGADELTYNLHILVRFELEVEILTGQIQVKNLPDAWNAKYSAYLGITPPTDTLGCLQDVHWSRGSAGYFPTYTMGNLIGGQIWATLRNDLGDTDELMAKGEFGAILEWLSDKVYSKAQTRKPKELIADITGRPMEAADWLSYASAKFKEIYRLV
ncbi:MAG: carboxypeptidase M32 [Fimbriimonas sp.]|nr:carboxypeptidase M32 [Fimbriimonas sp.]